MVARLWSSSRISCRERLHLRCDGNAANSFPTKQGKDPTSRATRRKGLLWMWAGPSCFLSRGDGYVGELLEWQQGCEGPFGSSRGEVLLASRRLSGNGHHLAWRGEPPGFSRVAAGALDLRREPQGSALVASGKASPYASCSGASQGASRVSSSVDAGA